MTMGISLTVSEIVVPSSATIPTGSASARTSASRSRRICVSSLRTWARMRFITQPLGRRGGGLLSALRFFHDHEEHVLQRVVLIARLEHANARLLEPRCKHARCPLRVPDDDHVHPIAEQSNSPVLNFRLQP